MRIGIEGSLAVVVGALALASAAVAATPDIRFTIGSTLLALPQPTGFCLPTEDQAPLAEAIAAADNQNMTVSTLLACNRNPAILPWSNYVLIKTPTAMVGRVFDKASILDEFDGIFSGPNSPKFDDKTTQEVAKGTERALGVRVEVTGTFGYAGRDADCVYLAGPMQAQVEGRIIKGLIATCITVSWGKLVAVNLYKIAPNPDLTEINAMKAQARAIGITIHRVKS